LQLARLAADAPDPSRLAVFGGPSARFFDLVPSGASAETVGSLADARLALGRMRDLPSRVLVTDELSGLERAGDAITPVATLCRPARIDRRAPCLGVCEWRLSAAAR
jgi:hypothetical protein